jgi:hypothetical protein
MESIYRSYGHLKKTKFESYFWQVKVFGGSEGTYPPIFKGCEHDGVKTRLMAIAVYEI